MFAGWGEPIQGRPMFQVVKKITTTRLSFLHCQRNIFGIRSKDIEVIQSRLHELLVLDPSEENQLESHTLSYKLDSFLAVDHVYWGQRAKISWLTYGNRNTKFSHRKASNRRAKNRLIAHI